MQRFKKRIIKEYVGLIGKVTDSIYIVNEENYYDVSRNLEKAVQRMIGRLKYR